MKNPLFSALILTLFPEMFPGPLGQSLAGKALEAGIWSLETLDIRDFATDKHRTVDDSPYGGGRGMVMKPDVLGRALDRAREILPDAPMIYFSPRGVPMTQRLIHELLIPPTTNHQPSTILLCGRFEGIDQRVIDHYGLMEVSLGDFVLSGGEIPALALLDAAVRLLPGVIGNDEATAQESFNIGPESALLLEYPHYTRPPEWNGRSVPDVLLSGDHRKIEEWRFGQSKALTQARRPDLIKNER